MVVRERVKAAQGRQLRRAKKLNARLSSREVADGCALDDPSWQCLGKAAQRFRLSPRACHRILKVARTIADLDGGDRYVLFAAGPVDPAGGLGREAEQGGLDAAAGGFDFGQFRH